MLPIYDEHSTAMGPQCPLHESRDMYKVQELLKVEESPSRWRCDYCGKTFYGELYIDVHMDNRHSDKIRNVSGTSIKMTLRDQRLKAKESGDENLHPHTLLHIYPTSFFFSMSK